jgi:RNA polymerase primary sigma factor
MMIRKYILMGIVSNSRLVALPANKQTCLSTSESLDVPAFDDDNDTNKADMLSGDINVNTDLDSLAADLARVMRKVLDERAINIVCKVFGIGCEPMFLDQIGAEYDITKERARQILQESLKKMGASGKILALLKNYKG